MIRKIYQIQCFTPEGDLVFRRYAANLKTARKIAREPGADIRLLAKNEWYNVHPDWVERRR